MATTTPKRTVSGRERPAQPPQGFRKAILVAVKRAVLARQEGACAHCGRRLPAIEDRSGILHFDHRPALTARGWDGADTIPPANDPAHIEALHLGCHETRTKGDVRQRAKTIRRQIAEDSFQAALAQKWPGKKRQPKGTIRSRNTLRRR